MDFLKNIDGSNVNLTPKGIILGNVQFEGNLPVPSCMSLYWKHDNLLFFDNEKDSEKIRPHSVSSISNSFDHLLIIFTSLKVIYLYRVVCLFSNITCIYAS
jgi:hypothetical protein